MMMQFSFHVGGSNACSFLLLTVYPELAKQRMKSLQNDWTSFLSVFGLPQFMLL